MSYFALGSFLSVPAKARRCGALKLQKGGGRFNTSSKVPVPSDQKTPTKWIWFDMRQYPAGFKDAFAEFGFGHFLVANVPDHAHRHHHDTQNRNPDRSQAILPITVASHRTTSASSIGCFDLPRSHDANVVDRFTDWPPALSRLVVREPHCVKRRGNLRQCTSTPSWHFWAINSQRIKKSRSSGCPASPRIPPKGGPLASPRQRGICG
jgi:hypothetical protein